jgi:hypothetical protein
VVVAALAALAGAPTPRPARAAEPAVEPAAAAAAAGVQLRVTSPRPYLVLGADGSIDLDVEVVGRGAEAFSPARVFATVGTLELPRAAAATAAPGRLVARYTPPADRFPQVALVVIEMASATQRVIGAARLPLHGTTEVPLRSDPGASVTLRIQDRTFGPVTADRQGHVKIPVEVPPGVRDGVARAVDATGNLRETDVDLQPAPFPRVLIVPPPAIEAGNFADVAVLAVDPAGEWVPSPRLSLRASDGLVHPLGGLAQGEGHFLVEAPRLLRGGALALTAVAAGTPLARADMAVPLNPGPPQSLVLAPSSRRLVVGGGGSVQVAVSAHDRFGNPVSAGGAVALVDRQPVPVQITAAGQGVLTVTAPARYTGIDHVIIEVALGVVHVEQEIRLTGGPPATLTLDVREPRLIADGTRGTELRVQATDSNGTPTMIPGLSWETPGGRVRNVRMPREGEYLADFIPDRAQDPHREPVGVMASATLRADATVEVVPAPPRLLAAARVGFFTNLGHAAGPAAFVEALTPVRLGPVRFAAGLTAGYLRDDIASVAPTDTGDVPTRLVVDQLPVLALARYRLQRMSGPDLAVDAGLGLSFARAELTSPGTGFPDVVATARAVAWQVAAETAFPLRPGRLVVGVRYLWISLGRTSQGDVLSGNAAGILGDLGYRLVF